MGVCLGGHACKKRGVGENNRPAKSGLPVLYVYMCTYICSTTRALSHTPCGAVASTVAVDGTLRGAVNGQLRSLGYEGQRGLMCDVWIALPLEAS